MIGKCSIFGGPNDKGMTNDTGLSFYEPFEADQRPDLFLPGPLDVPTWKRLIITSNYCAVRIQTGMPRFVYHQILIKVLFARKFTSIICSLVDRGPGRLDRIVDLSPGAADALGVDTDDIVQISIFNPEILLSWKP